MKADQLVIPTQLFKACIYGDAGVGKSCFAAQMPGPIEYWDFDNKFDSAFFYLRRIGQEAKLKEIDVHSFGKLPLKEKIPAWTKRTALIDKAILEKQPLPFRTLVIDSITSLGHHLMEDYMYRSRLGIRRPEEGLNGLQDFQFYEKDMTRMLVGLLALDINLVVIGHIEADKDELTGAISRRVLCKGKSLAPTLPMWFSEVYAALTKPDGSRFFLTQPMNGYVARTQRGLAKEVPMTVEAVLSSK